MLVEEAPARESHISLPQVLDSVVYVHVKVLLVVMFILPCHEFHRLFSSPQAPCRRGYICISAFVSWEKKWTLYDGWGEGGVKRANRTMGGYVGTRYGFRELAGFRGHFSPNADKITLGNPFAHPGKNTARQFCYLRGKYSFWLI